MSPAASEAAKVYVFFSYAHRDKALRDKLEDHLSILKYRGLISAWHDREITAGEEWAQQIDIHLNTAHIILLLISSNFMASGYCYGIEMKQALERHERGEARVVPILLRPVLFTDAPFAKLQMLPTNAKPVVDWRNRDSAFVDIALNIERLIQLHFAAKVDVPPVQSVGISPIYNTASPLSPPGPQRTYASPQPPKANRRSRLVPIGLAFAALLFFVGLPSLLYLNLSFSVHTPAVATAVAILTSSPNASSVATPSPGTTSPPILTFNPDLITDIVIISIFLIVVALLVWTFRSIIKVRKLKREKAEREAIRLQEASKREAAEHEVFRFQRPVGRLEKPRGPARRPEAQEAAGEKAYYTSALRAYEQALDHNSSDGSAYRGKGNALYALGLYEEALQAFEQAVRCDANAAAYTGMGNALAKLQRYEEALAAYEQAIALDPTFAPAYNGMSDVLEQLGRSEDAQQAREKAQQLGYE